MNKILIVDDNQENIDDIKNIIDVYFKEKDFNYHIDCLKNPTDFDHNHQYDIIFLDIDMPQQSGFDLAKSIPLNTFIVFVSHRAVSYTHLNIIISITYAIDKILIIFF